MKVKPAWVASADAALLRSPSKICLAEFAAATRVFPEHCIVEILVTWMIQEIAKNSQQDST